MHRACAWVVGLSILTSAGAASAQQCRRDKDCPGDSVCEQGTCVGEDGQPVATDHPLAPPTSSAPAAASPSRRVRVEFVLRGTDPVEVLDPESGASCKAPCALELFPGEHKVRVNGREPQTITVPAWESGAKFSVGAGNGNGTLGAVFAGIGIPAVTGGAIFLLVGSVGNADYGDVVKQKQNKYFQTMGAGFLIPGVVMTVIGIVALGKADDGDVRTPTGNEKPIPAAFKVTPMVAVEDKGGYFGLAAAF